MNSVSSLLTSPVYTFSSDVETLFSSRTPSTEERVNALQRITIRPFLWINRAFNFTHYLSTLMPFANFFLALGAFFHKLNMPMKTITGVAYVFLLFQNVYYLRLQNSFMNKMRDGCLNTLDSLSSQNIQDQIETLHNHLQLAMEQPNARNCIQHAWTIIEECRDNPALREEDIISRIQAVKNSILLDTLVTVKEYPNSLDKRVTKWMFNKIQSQIDGLISELQSGDPERQRVACQNAEEFVMEIDDEARKILLVHVIGTISIALTIVSMILLAVGCPIALPLFLCILAYGCTALEYIVFYGMENHKGWDIHWGDCVPDWIRGIFQRQPEPAIV